MNGPGLAKVLRAVPHEAESRALPYNPGPQDVARELATRLAEMHNGNVEHVTFDEGSFYAYQPATGVWAAVSEETVYNVACSMHGMPIIGAKTPFKVTEGKAAQMVVSLRNQLVANSKYKFANAVRGVAFLDGFVTVQGGKITLAKHSPRHLARHRHEADYDDFERSDVIEKHCDVIFAHEPQDERRRIVALLQEWCGISLIGEATKYQKCLIFYSKNHGGGEGKGSTIELLREAFPPDSRADLAPELFHGFGLATLIGKLGNFVTEITDLSKTMATWKAVVAGDNQTVNIKYKPFATIRPIAGHVFSCNKLPPVTEQSEAFYRRVIVLRFQRQMHNDAAQVIDYATQMMASPTARARLAAWALEGAARLQRQERYTECENSRRALAEYRHSHDPVLQWLTERLPWHAVHPRTLVDESGRIEARALLEAFNAWADGAEHKKMTPTAFGTAMARLPFIRRVNRSDGKCYALDEAAWGRYFKAYNDSQA